MVEMIEKHINLKTRGLPIRIDVVQGTNAVPIKFTLMDYDIPAGAEARIYVRKPSNTEVYNNCTIDNNSVIVQPTTQMYAEVGRLKAQIQLIAGDGVAASFVFCIDVAENLVSSSAVESCNEFGILDTLINEAREMIATLGGLKPHALAAPIQNLATTVAGSALDATMGKKLQDGIDTLNSGLTGKINKSMTRLTEGADPRTAAVNVGFYTINKPSGFGAYIDGWFDFLLMKSDDNPNFRKIVGLYKNTLYVSYESNSKWSDWIMIPSVGLLSNLKTTNKDSVVAALNELNDILAKFSLMNITSGDLLQIALTLPVLSSRTIYISSSAIGSITNAPQEKTAYIGWIMKGAASAYATIILFPTTATALYLSEISNGALSGWRKIHIPLI